LAQIAGIEQLFPPAVIGALRAVIADERAQPTRAEMRTKLRAVRATRTFDELDPLMLSVLEPDFCERESRTPERVRKRAGQTLRDLRQGKGNKAFYPRPGGIDSATLCALIVSERMARPAITNRQLQALCATLYVYAGADASRRGGASNKRGFWRDHLRAARQWRDTPFGRRVKSCFL
jgi:hypothetical protein